MAKTMMRFFIQLDHTSAGEGSPATPLGEGRDETAPSFDPEDEGGCGTGGLAAHRGLVNRIRLHFGLRRSLSRRRARMERRRAPVTEEEKEGTRRNR